MVTKTLDNTQDCAAIIAGRAALAGRGPSIRSIGVVVLILCVALFAGLRPVHAAGTDQMPLAYGFKMAGDANRMRVVVRFDREPELNWFLLRSPHRLVIDLTGTRFGFDQASLAARGMVADVHYGLVGENHSRIIVSMDTPFEVEHMRIVKNEDAAGFRAIVDIISVSDQRFSQLLEDQMQTTAATSTAKSDRLGNAPAARNKPFTIVIDPGHGGIDGGARGVKGSQEKVITLAFSKELRKELEKIENIRVILSRTDDVFLRLDERVRIARQSEADLFLSIHADKIRQSFVRGATVYTLSEKASDAVSSELAESENRSDAIAGIVIKEDSAEVTDILLDLVHRETQTFSIKLARRLVGEMSEAVEMINNPHRSAGFRVLRAYDIPSVLIELGYLSNTRDEALMNDPSWRHKLAASIASALMEYRDNVASVTR